MPDEIPLWFAIPSGIALWTTLIALMWRDQEPDPNNDLSRLDELDGLSDRPRH